MWLCAIGMRVNVSKCFLTFFLQQLLRRVMKQKDVRRRDTTT
jgi:hypothetical protein